MSNLHPLQKCKKCKDPLDEYFVMDLAGNKYCSDYCREGKMESKEKFVVAIRVEKDGQSFEYKHTTEDIAEGAEDLVETIKYLKRRFRSDV